MIPELMPQREYVEWKLDLYRRENITLPRIVNRGKIEGDHLFLVREAVNARRDIHVENRHTYKPYIENLRHYSTNGNLAVFDRNKNMRFGLTLGDIEFSQYLERKRKRI